MPEGLGQVASVAPVVQLERTVFSWIQLACRLCPGTSSEKQPLQQHLTTLSQLQKDIQQAQQAVYSVLKAQHGTADTSSCISTLTNLLRLQALGNSGPQQEQALGDSQRELAKTLGADNAAAFSGTLQTLYEAWVQKLQEIPLQVTRELQR